MHLFLKSLAFFGAFGLNLTVTDEEKQEMGERDLMTLYYWPWMEATLVPRANDSGTDTRVCTF